MWSSGQCLASSFDRQLNWASSKFVSLSLISTRPAGMNGWMVTEYEYDKWRINKGRNKWLIEKVCSFEWICDIHELLRKRIFLYYLTRFILRACSKDFYITCFYRTTAKKDLLFGVQNKELFSIYLEEDKALFFK